MRLDDQEVSQDYEIQEGGSGRGVRGGGFGLPIRTGGLGCGGLIILVIIALAMGLDPIAMMSGQVVPQYAPTTPPASNVGGGGMTADGRALDADGRVGNAALTTDEKTTLLILDSTRQVWTQLFSRRGENYSPPKISFYTNAGMSGCGAAQAAMGPFYCPSDHKIYIDTSFYQELSQRLGAPGDFPIAYVVAHEVGHHIQTLTGVAAQVRARQAQASEAQANALQVRMELQADCLAGVWAANDRNLMEPGDMEEGLRAAEAIGDDMLQRAARGVVVPESFTHGTSQQRMQWLKRGLTTGDPDQCDTFAARTL